MTFVEQVNLLKKQKKITTDDISRKTGIPKGTLGKLFSGVTEEPKLSTVFAIAEALDCPVSLLLGIEADGSHGFANDTEKLLIEKYRSLDNHGRELADFIISKEYDRILIQNALAQKQEAAKPLSAKANSAATILPIVDFSEKAKTRSIPLFDLPVSAGTGVFLDSSDYDSILVKLTERTEQADFALRVKGNSMEPEYHDGDILIIKEQEQVERGQLGIFIGDSEGYFKKFGGDRLISLNPEYTDIPLSKFSDISCRGLVIGRLKSSQGN